MSKIMRPSKKTSKIVDALLEAIATGAPYTICCAAVGVHIDTFMHWKRTDRAFADRVEQVAAQNALQLLKKIRGHGEKEFQPLSWLLERRLPGFRGHRMKIDFSGDPVTVEELFAPLEKLCGGPAGWQLAQRLAGYAA